MRRARLFFTVVVASISLGAGGVAAQGGFAGLDGLFSRSQASRGEAVFAAQCAICHSPAQAAGYMLERGSGQAVGVYHARLSELMPPQSAVRPSAQQFGDVMAYLALVAGARPGAADAALDSAAWRAARLPVNAAVRTTAAAAAAAAPDLGWSAWRGDLLGQAYSPADQIDASNVKTLKLAWRWSGANFGPTPESRNITTPLMAEGRLYATAGVTRDVVAIDPATGETLWVWRPAEEPARFDNAPRKGAGRGVAYWSDGSARGSSR